MRKGARPVLAPEDFFITDENEKIKNGELERAKKWGENVMANCVQMVR
ncbi:MAG: hypothetical protein R3275_13705 [Saprospiraceae bacterium]|nr:hypothetical protein [Saprospiraceae bacterium]